MGKTLVLTVLLISIAYYGKARASFPSGKIGVDVVTAIETDKQANIIVKCGDPPDDKHASILIDETVQKIRVLLASSTDTRRSGSKSGEKLTKLVNLIQGTSTAAMEPVIELCKTLKADFEVMWIIRAIFVRSAGEDLVGAVANLEVVRKIELEKKIPITLPRPPRPVNPPTNFPITSPTTTTTTTPRPEVVGNSSWNLGLMNARCSDITCLGNGVRVGIIDTGALWNHTEIKDAWLGEFGWWDGANDTVSPFPYDEAGHGTSVAGVICGKTVGVAPNAKWLMCRAGSEELPDTALMMCAQFMACPWPWNDTSPERVHKDCSKRPHVVNNSWSSRGGGQTLDPTDNIYYRMLEMWNTLGIISVFSMGNNGPGCATGGWPATADIALAVGSVDYTATISRWSSRGPASMTRYMSKNATAYGSCVAHSLGNAVCTSNDIRNKPLCLIRKPDIVAPGENMRSSWIGNVTDYNAALNGTSFSAPSVSGVLALMVCANPKVNWNYKLAYKILTETADTSMINLRVGNNKDNKFAKAANVMCNYMISGICNTYPNNVYGYGLAYACKAVKAVKKLQIV